MACISFIKLQSLLTQPQNSIQRQMGRYIGTHIPTLSNPRLTLVVLFPVYYREPLTRTSKSFDQTAR